LTVKQYLQQPPGDHWLYPSVTHRDVRLLFRRILAEKNQRTGDGMLCRRSSENETRHSMA
jgi:CRISPR/Cas system-associated protein Cas7 (RAMP superfamily)